MDTHLSFSAVVSPFSAVDVLSHWSTRIWSSLDLGFSSFFLDCRCLHVNSRVRVLLCSSSSAPLVACLTLRVRALEKTPSHYGVAIGVEFDTLASGRGYGRGSWLAQSADYEWTLTHVAEQSSDINLSFTVG